MTPPSPPGPSASNGRVFLGAASTVVSGLAINWISSAYTPAAIIILIAALVSLVMLVVVGRLTAVPAGSTGSGIPGLSRTTMDLIMLGLVSLLIGGVFSGLSLLPIQSTNTIDLLQRGTTHNYEIVAFGLVLLVGVLAAIRGADPLQLLVFVTSLVSGVTLVEVTLRPGNVFLTTFVTWWFLCVGVTFLVTIVPDLLRIFRRLFNV